MERLLGIVDRATYLGAVMAATAFALLAAMLIVEVFATSFLAWSQPWSVEYSSYLLAATLFLGSGWALRSGGHIRVNALVSLLPARLARAVDLLATGFACGITGYAAMALVDQTWRTFQLGSRSYFPTETPLVYPQAVLALSFVLLTLAFCARLLRLLLGKAAEIAPPAVTAPPERTP